MVSRDIKIQADCMEADQTKSQERGSGVLDLRRHGIGLRDESRLEGAVGHIQNRWDHKTNADQKVQERG